MGLSITLRTYVRRHDLRVMKNVYKNVVVPYYHLRGVPLYDITTSAQYGYTWFRIPKNGTHSVMQLLEQHCPPDINSSWVPYYRKEHRERFRFCVMRNPWDRLVSVYCNKVQMKLMYPECWDRDFDYFIDFVTRQDLRHCDAHLRLQTAMFPGNDIDFVAKMERFGNDIAEIMQRVNVPNIKVPHLGMIKHEEYRHYYTPELMDRVGVLYKGDVSFGQYRF